MLHPTINRQHMDDRHEPPSPLNSIVIDDDTIEVANNEIVINDNDKSQRQIFYSKIENYKNKLNSSMQEKTMITKSLYADILNALKCGKGGKQVGIDVKFYSWCKTHFKIILNIDMELLCSKKKIRELR